MNNIDIKSLFLELQEIMKLQLDLSRKNILHAPSKGNACENEWISWLNQYLPLRYKTDSAFIIDHEGNLSEQMDLVIYDRHFSPFVFLKNGIKYIPAESIYAVFEVKQELNKTNLEYAAGKIKSVRQLKRTSTQITHAGGHFAPKEPFKIIGGVLTTSSNWKPPLGKSFSDIILNLSDIESIDIGCSITHGAFYMDETKDKKCLKVSNPDEILINFFTNLLYMLQQKGSVPAMDILKYTSALSSDNT